MLCGASNGAFFGVGASYYFCENKSNPSGSRSQMPGVSEVAGLVVVLINLVSDSRGNAAANDQTVKRSRSIIIMLHRAADVLGRNVSHPPCRYLQKAHSSHDYNSSPLIQKRGLIRQ